MLNAAKKILRHEKHRLGEIIYYTVSNDEKINAGKKSPQKRGVTPRKHRLGEIILYIPSLTMKK